MGALTIAVNNRGIMGDLRYAEVSATFSSSYAADGDTGLTASALGWDRVLCGIVTSQDDGYVFSYNATTGAITAHLLDFVADDNIAGIDDTIISTAGVFGISGDGVAFQVGLPQVAAATDLSTTPGTIRLLMLGR